MRFKILLLFMLFSSALFAQQQITVGGIVTDGSEALLGVNVTVKGSSEGTVTDANGKYSISVSPKATLTFTYLGYATQEVAVDNRTSIDIVMKTNDQSLDEVVVVGVSMKKSDLTGAVSNVSADVLEQKPVTNITQALQGNAAGVFVSNAARPDQDASIRIRGINTISGSTDPIYVVDGLVMDNFKGGFSSINLDDVASVEVLKDASSTALYGSRARNGVVLITTKKGKSGAGKITYDGWYGVQSYAKMPKTMNSRQLFELSEQAAMNSYDAAHPDASAADRTAFLQNQVLTPYAGNNTGGFVFSQNDVDAYNNPNFKDYNWLDDVTRTGIQQSHTIGFQGGSDKGSYYLSFGYSDEQGVVKQLSDRKYTGRVNADHAIKTWLKVGTNTSFTRDEAQVFNDDNVYNSARNANPTLAPSDTLMFLPNWNGTYNDNNFNPITSLRLQNNRIRSRLVSANFVNLNPIKGLNIRTQFSVNYFTEGQYQYQPNDIAQAVRNANNGNAQQNFDNQLTWQWDNSISYDRKFGVHRLMVMVGQSATHTNRNWLDASANGYDTNDFGYYSIGSNTGQTELSSDFTTKTLESYFARANYDYMNKYLLTATLRYDGSSNFAPGYQWGLFPSFSAAWNMTEENFMKNQSIFNQLKLRVGYGVVGNQDVPDYAFLTLYVPTIANGSITYIPNSDGRRGTPDITWESQHQTNIGADMAFLKNRIRFTADVFSVLNSNLLMTRSLSGSSGFKIATDNVGEIKNKGIELTVSVQAIKTKDFEWNISANFSADRNKVTKLFDTANSIYKYDDYGNLTTDQNLLLGQSRNSIYILKYGGIAQESDMTRLNQINWNGHSVNPGDAYPVDTNGDGQITNADRVVVGSQDPKSYGGFSTDLTYKGLSLNAVFNYSYGAKKLSTIYQSLITSVGRGPASIDLLNNTWTTTNTGAEFPRSILNAPGTNYNVYSLSDMSSTVQDGSFLRLSALTLAYTLPSRLISNWKLSNLRIYATGSNLFILTPYKGYDPETGDWYPPTRMITFGLNLAF